MNYFKKTKFTINMKKDKTFLEYYNTLEEPYKTEAIDNVTEQGGNLEYTAVNLEGALYSGFRWSPTPQGYDYWKNLVIKLKL